MTWINSIFRLSEFEFKLLLCSAIKFLSTANESYHAYKIDNFNSTKIWILILFSRVFWLKSDFSRNWLFSRIKTYPPNFGQSSDFNLKFISAWKPKNEWSEICMSLHEEIKSPHFNLTWSHFSLSRDIIHMVSHLNDHVIVHVLSHSKGFDR